MCPCHNNSGGIELSCIQCSFSLRQLHSNEPENVQQTKHGFQTPCSGQNFSAVQATVRGGPFLVTNPQQGIA